MNITQLRAFHAVAAEGGFTRAAKRLHISQPAVTVQVRALEQRYGIELFRRKGQRVELSDFGRELWRRARRVFLQIDDLEELLESAGRLELGRLVLGADGPFSAMDLVAAFRRRHPKMQVAMRMGNARRVLADLEAGETDVAVLNLIGAGEGLHHATLYLDRIVAFVASGHPWSARSEIGLGELARAPLILREPGSATRLLLESRLAERRLAPKLALELGSREAVREAVLAGLGVGTVFASELVPHERLCALEIAGAELCAPVCLACLPERRELGAVRAFFALARGVGGRPRAP
ncbi:MAG: LysR substrate-binding domain-containing protein [Geminicoccaceae bacterium]